MFLYWRIIYVSLYGIYDGGFWMGGREGLFFLFKLGKLYVVSKNYLSVIELLYDYLSCYSLNSLIFQLYTKI